MLPASFRSRMYPISLANLPLATAQQVFDQVSAHLLLQNARATDINGGCVYHSKLASENLPTGHVAMCAAGCLISPDEYRHDFEGKSWCEIASDGKVPSAHETLVRELQVIHDSKDVDKWHVYLRELANNYELEFNDIESD